MWKLDLLEIILLNVPDLIFVREQQKLSKDVKFGILLISQVFLFFYGRTSVYFQCFTTFRF